MGYDTFGLFEYGDDTYYYKCVLCGCIRWSHETSPGFDHPFVANNLELLEYKSIQWEKAHPQEVLA